MGKNRIKKRNTKKESRNKKSRFNKLLLVISVAVALSVLIAFAEASSVSSIDCTLMNIYYILNNAIFIVGLVLMLLGGTLYAAAQVMPGQTKGTLQGYGMGLIMGGVIGVIAAELAPYIFNIITNNTINAYSNGCPQLIGGSGPGSAPPPGGGGGGSGGGGSGCYSSKSSCKSACSTSCITYYTYDCCQETSGVTSCTTYSYYSECQASCPKCTKVPTSYCCG